jgi:DNA-binding response OmpR family regulator
MQEVVLIVEDSSYIVSQLTEELEEAGFKVFSATRLYKLDRVEKMMAEENIIPVAIIWDRYLPDGQTTNGAIQRWVGCPIMVAMSSESRGQMQAGCTHEVGEKCQAAKLVIQLLK